MEAIIEKQKPLTKKIKSNEANSKNYDQLEAKQRYIYGRKNAEDPTANLIDELLIKCNQKDYGATIDFGMLVGYAINLIKESDIQEIQNNSLSDEDRVNDLVKKYNIKHGTNFTMYEFVLKGLMKKSNKGVNQ